MAMNRALSERIHREYMSVLRARRGRAGAGACSRTSRGEKAETTAKDADLALCAETFLGVEMYLPDYVAAGT